MVCKEWAKIIADEKVWSNHYPYQKKIAPTLLGSIQSYVNFSRLVNPRKISTLAPPPAFSSHRGEQQQQAGADEFIPFVDWDHDVIYLEKESTLYGFDLYTQLEIYHYPLPHQGEKEQDFFFRFFLSDTGGVMVVTAPRSLHFFGAATRDSKWTECSRYTGILADNSVLIEHADHLCRVWPETGVVTEICDLPKGDWATDGKYIVLSQHDTYDHPAKLVALTSDGAFVNDLTSTGLGTLSIRDGVVLYIVGDWGQANIRWDIRTDEKSQHILKVYPRSVKYVGQHLVTGDAIAYKLSRNDPEWPRLFNFAARSGLRQLNGTVPLTPTEAHTSYCHIWTDHKYRVLVTSADGQQQALITW